MENGKIKLKGKLAAVANLRAREQEYWLNRLAGEWVKSHFPYDYNDVKKTDTPHVDGETVSFRLSGEHFSILLHMSSGNDYAVHAIGAAALTALLGSYTGSRDIVLGSPIYRQDFKGEIINRVLILRNRLNPTMTFRELLLQVKESIDQAVENQNYPVEILAERLKRPISPQENFPLFDISILLENIHDKSYLQHIPHSMTFVLVRKEHTLEGEVQYNPSCYTKKTVERIVSHFLRLMQTVLSDVNKPLNGINILSGEEKKQLIDAFNDTRSKYPGHKTIHQLFEAQAEKMPGKHAVCVPIDLDDIYDQLNAETVNPAVNEKIGTCCFNQNPYIYRCPLQLPEKNVSLRLLKTNHHNSVVVNNNLVKLLGFFDGNRTIKSIYSRVKNIMTLKRINFEFLIYSMSRPDLLEVTFQFNRQPEIFSARGFKDFVKLVQALYKNHLIELVGIGSEESGFEESLADGSGFAGEEILSDESHLEDLLIKDKPISKAEVLLLGDTPGIPTTGLLYLASYLSRKGIKASCRFYDASQDYLSMKQNTEALLEKLRPEVVAISLKWFLYIARVIDMCTIVKEYAAQNSLDIKVVVGGNTASYYWGELIAYDCIDYLVRGDGEEPLLKICRGEEHIPNCIYKKNGNIIKNPVTYIQDESHSPGIYLSHLHDILLSHHSSRLGTFFIYTHKGCAMNCLYCGGCNRAQQQTFNRKNVIQRGVAEVRKDILAAKPYASTFQFDFDILDRNLLDYCRQIWEGIDLSGHFCIIATLMPPSARLIKLVSETFKYVYWDFDITTPSERHRKQLFSLGLIKPQPSDEDILDFMGQCEAYDNIEVRLNLITGLPYYTLEDNEPGEKLLSKIINTYSCFGELHWARLHAQPGAPIVEDAENYHMHSYASLFEDFFKYSEKNFNRDTGYSTVENLVYPYVYFKDDQLNSRVTTFYVENNRRVEEHKKRRRRKLIVSPTTYGELNERANQLRDLLRAKGVCPGEIVGILLERSIEIPIAILAVLKAGGAYMPIDPEFPSGRIQYMLRDSSANVLITTSNLMKEDRKNLEIVFLDSSYHTGSPASTLPDFQAAQPSDLAYVIYTSGTTGKPKGTLLTHENVVNYVHWFTTAAQLTKNDRTPLNSSFAFDLGYTSLYSSLLKGCELHILPREIYLLAQRFLDYIKQKAITYIKVTPSLFSVIVNAPNFSGEICKSLRVAAIGGEAINVNDIEKAHDICPHLEIMNHYGPTEATIGCVATFIDFDNFDTYKTHPVIGMPINNTQVYILGKDLDLLPIGAAGELCISGTGLARGYLNRPELTAEKFCKNFFFSPFTFHLSPLYKTGDLARWLVDGTIEFLGRIDKQVKVRGYRIELGEIENRLLHHNAITDAVAVVKEDKYICAYIVTTGGRIEPKPTKEKEIINEKEGSNQAMSFVSRFGETVKKSHDRPAIKSNGRTLTYGSLDKYAARIAREILENYDDTHRLSKGERQRYKRQMLLYGWGQAFQEKLKGTTVFVAGAGGGGSPTIMQLALLGFGTIKICDYDVVELSNLNRQFLHDEERIGMKKTLSAKQTVNRINPNVNVITIPEKLTKDNVFELVGDSEIIFDMFDGPADKFILSQCAVAKQIPHVIISMADLNAYTAVLHTPHTPCYHCIFSKEKLDAITAGMKSFVENYSKNPLAVAVTSLFISTGTAITETLKILLEEEEPAYNKFFYFNHRGAIENLRYTASYKSMTHLFSDHFNKICKNQGYDWDIGWRGNLTEVLDITPDPDCPVCGPKGKEKRKKPEEQKKTLKEEKPKANDKRKTVALLLNPDIDMAAGITGALKAGKTYVPLAPSSPMEQLSQMLEDSESRIIITGDNHFDLAKKLRDKVNKNIKVININHPDEFNGSDENLSLEKFDIEITRGQPSYILYAFGPDGDLNFNASVEELHRILLNGNGPYISGLENNKQDAGAAGPDTDTLSMELREYLQEELPDYMIPSYFVRLDKISLTPNGKVDWKALPDPKLEAEGGDTYAAPRNEKEEKLVEIWSNVLKAERIGIDSNFFEMGLDSIKAIQAAARMSQEGLKVEMNDIFSNPTIRQLSKSITHTVHKADQEVIEGEVKLSPIQKWFFETNITERHHFNMAVMLYREEGFDEEFLKKAFQKIVEHHDALRIVFKFYEDEIIQENRNIEGDMFDLEIVNLDKEEPVKELIKKEANRIHSGIDLEAGPLVKLGLFKTGNGDHLLIVIHHLVIDGISWRILFEDIETLFQQYNTGEPFDLPLKSDSFKAWADKLSQYANSELFLQEKSFWANMETLASPIPRFSGDCEEENYMKDSDTLSFSLNEEETHQLLTETNKAFGTEINDILLTTLGLAFKKIYGHRYLLIALEGHGREQILADVDINRTIGFFTSEYPVLLDISYESDLSRQIMEIKDTLHKLPNRGIGYGILKYLTAKEHKKEIEFRLNPQVSFNYLGQFDADVTQLASFEISTMPTGDLQSMNMERPYDFEISGMITNKQLAMSIIFSKKQYKRETIETLTARYKAELKRIISYCSSRGEAEVSPSDFTYKGLSIDQLDQLFD